MQVYVFLKRGGLLTSINKFSIGEVVLYSHMQIHAEHNDTMKTSEDFFKKIYLSLYLKDLCVRGSWRPNRTAIY